MAQTAANKRRSNLQYRYQLTPETYTALLVIQKYRCAVCEALVPLSVDHCHRQGHVRGLLCSGCNKALGWLGDSEALMRRALVYLGGHC